jgi:hypothetical protein
VCAWVVFVTSNNHIGHSLATSVHFVVQVSALVSRDGMRFIVVFRERVSGASAVLVAGGGVETTESLVTIGQAMTAQIGVEDELYTTRKSHQPGILRSIKT